MAPLQIPRNPELDLGRCFNGEQQLMYVLLRLGKSAIAY